MKGAFVYNKKLKKLHVWNTLPSIFQTSHQKMLDRLGYSIDDCVGGSIKGNGDVSFRSRSINLKNFGNQDISASDISDEIRHILTSGTIPIYNMDYQITKIFLKY